MPDITIRPIALADCTQEYVDWLNDVFVNRWLETRHKQQTIETIREFVSGMLKSKDSWLMAICCDGKHIGNIKIGPRHPIHDHADLSYFIGNREMWGKGHATKAVDLMCQFGFKKLKLHRLQAGLYSGNPASRRVLLKNGFSYEGKMMEQLKTPNGWDHHEIYGRICHHVAI